MSRAWTGIVALTLGCGEPPEPNAAQPSVPVPSLEPPAPAPAPACDPDAFVHAPTPVEIDGLPAVPIDVLGLDAELEFERTAGFALARLSFQLGTTGGMPMLDLRQTPEWLTLDGEPLATTSLSRHDFGRGLAAGLAILAVPLEPCSVHALELGYPLATPDAPGAVGPEIVAHGVRFDLHSSDLDPGRYLESWLPANLPFDRHPISLAVRIEAGTTRHTLVTNASVDELGEQVWQLEFPSTTTSMDPMLVIVPTDELVRFEGVSARGLPFTIHVATALGLTPEGIAERLLASLDRLERRLGPYPHPALTVVVRDGRSMEYAAATTTALGSLEHELAHSWWGRGLSPAHPADGWIDEGWVEFVTDAKASRVLAFDWDASSVVLRDPHPFARDTPRAAYTHGARVFAGIADLVGAAELDAAMAEIQRELGPIGSITTAELERQLFCKLGQRLEIRRAFHRFVHGRAGEPEPAAADVCRR